ncbi:TadE/TadG family type IV pilus assembly protein [Limobrevibacterium gyesilva]|uniref:Pilus assembly protein n=1 Tax=Limobrevibacterium gyesilva TaxID=2991712 RepID=A0AA41YN61_9PROT|nr:TadE family protein [Limobrevibacterium gyesilva]MCW3475432.1 pilus assembly protein [Limobrevibacterium gyesilva]
MPAHRKGTTTLEFALIGPTLLLIVFFIMGAALLLWAKGTLQMAASQTARCTAIGSTNCTDAKAYAVSLITTWGAGAIIPSIDVSVQSNNSCNNMLGHFSKVTISTGSGIAWFVPQLSGKALTASACYPSGT